MPHQFQTQRIVKVDSITSETFINEFVNPQKPVVIKKLTADWEALKLWNFRYFKTIAGDLEVPLYDSKPITAEYAYNAPQARMKFGDYIDLLLSRPTDLRMFLFNLIKERPALKNHIRFPDIGLNLIKSLPYLFVGGEDSKVFMHYDIDLANILHVHLYGQKQCLLFPPSEARYLYKVPNSLKTNDSIDFSNPDFDKFPALAYAKGYITDLNPGETLYMPEGYWHYMHYVTPGFSISLRSLAKRPKHIFQALYNVSVMRLKENFMRKYKGESWLKQKQRASIINTHKGLNSC